MRYPTLKEFLEGVQRNAYITYPGFASLYVRHTQRFGFETLDVANLTAKQPGRGSFTRLIKHVRKTYPRMGIYVECVLNDRFEVKLLAMGFARCDVGMSACFFLSPLMEIK